MVLRIVMNEAKNIISKNNKLIYLEDVDTSRNIKSKSDNQEEKLDLERSLEKGRTTG
ncbi:MAG: hypothetical protein V8S33_06725 [Intestinibacter bartlettii]